MKQVQLILVGGFLGAGKTTLLARAAGALAARGRRVGLITNDQAADLVDTRLLAGQALAVEEIAGGCFCCRFGSLVESAELLERRIRPDVLIAEPVGSCTDLSATVVQPLKALYAEALRVAPLSVLADPARLRAALGDGPNPLPASVVYIFRKQIEEADLVVVSKADTLGLEARESLAARVAEAWPGRPVRLLSAATGEGVGAWLDEVTAGAAAGGRIADVDYDTYAEGEALLGWLNASVALVTTGEPDWPAVCLRLLDDLRKRLAARGAEIAHVKLLLESGGGAIVANVTRGDEPPALRGELPAPERGATLTLNARVHLDPEALREAVESAVAGLGVEARIERLSSFRPGRPEPVHRYGRVVDA